MLDIGSPTYMSNGVQRRYTFHGLRKNAACYLAEMGLNDGQIGAICAMTPDTVRKYTKRSSAYMIAQGAAENVKRGDVLSIKGDAHEEALNKCLKIKMVTPTGIEPVFQP